MARSPQHRLDADTRELEASAFGFLCISRHNETSLDPSHRPAHIHHMLQTRGWGVWVGGGGESETERERERERERESGKEKGGTEGR